MKGNNNLQYGDYYWIITVPTVVASTGFISAMADCINVSSNGDLILVNHNTAKDRNYQGLILAKGQWYNCFAADMFMGNPIVVENWEAPVYKSSEERLERAKVTPSIRFRVMRRDGFKCKLCGKQEKDGAVLTIDHIVPISSGGKSVVHNLQTLCQDCNAGKGKQTA